MRAHLRRLAVLLVILSCSSGDTGPAPVPTPASIAASGSTTFAGIVGAALTTSPSVLIMGSDGRPLVGGTVVFQVTGGGGQALGGSATTNSAGIATVGGWILGTAPGANTMTATVGALAPVTFTATGTVGAAARLFVASGEGQQGDVGTALAAPLVVRTADAFSNPVPNVVVNFAVSSGSGSLTPATTTSDAQGLASANLTLTAAGMTTVTVTSSAVAGTSVLFSASTGPTIAGQLLFVTGSQFPFGRQQEFRATGNGKIGLLFADLPADRGRTSSREAAALARPRGRLVVSYRPDAFALPISTQAYRQASVRHRAVEAYAAALAPFVNGGMIEQRETSPAIGAVRVEVAPGQRVDDVIASLRRDPRVLAVEEDGFMYTDDASSVWSIPPWRRRAIGGTSPLLFAPPSTHVFPTDPLFYTQLWNYAMVDLPRAWKTTTGSSSVVVGIIDTGVRPDHPGLATVLSTDQYDFVSNAPVFTSPQPICGTSQTFLSGRGTTTDEARPRTSALQPWDVFLFGTNPTCWTVATVGSHGSHISGTVSSPANDGLGGTGVNWNVRIRMSRGLGIFGSGSFFDIAQAVLWQAGLPAAVPDVTTGQTVQTTAAPIINMSLGSSFDNTALRNAVAAASANSLIIASAGNGANSFPSFPSGYPQVVSVVALAPDFGLASYTTIGTTVDLSAPGGDFRLGTTAGIVSTMWDFTTSTPVLAYSSGTSMASAHVSGVAALVLSANPGLTPAQLRTRIEQGAVDLGAPGRDNLFGFGVVNAFNSVTGTQGPTAATTVKALHVANGAVGRSVRLDADGRFIMARLTGGSYFLVAGNDEGTDHDFGVPGRRYSWFGATGAAPLTVTGSAVQNVAFTLRNPLESEPNDDLARAQPLFVNGWVAGQISAVDPKDVYAVMIPAAGTHTFETSGVLAACGAALDLDTVLRVFDSSGNQISTNDDTPSPTASYPGRLCSLITGQFQVGKYFVEVSAAAGSTTGSYRLHVRQGS